MTARTRMPDGFSKRSQSLWRREIARGGGVFSDTSSPERLAVFEQALRALDRSDQARKLVDSEGLIIGGTGKMAHAHPALRIETENRKLFAKLWTELDLDHEDA